MDHCIAGMIQIVLTRHHCTHRSYSRLCCGTCPSICVCHGTLVLHVMVDMRINHKAQM